MYIVKKRDFENINIREMKDSDKELIINWLKQKEIYESYLENRLNSSQIEDYFAKYLKASVYNRCYIIEYDRTPVGFIEQYPIQPNGEDSLLSVKICVGELSCQDYGIASASLEIVSQLIFDYYDIDYVVANIPYDNQKAIKSFKRAGFKKKKSYIKNNKKHYFMAKFNKSHLFI